MLYRGEIVRLPHGRGNGVVIDCSTDGLVHLYVGARRVEQIPGPCIEPIVEEYVECELIPTGRRAAQMTAWPLRSHSARRRLVGAE